MKRTPIPRFHCAPIVYIQPVENYFLHVRCISGFPNNRFDASLSRKTEGSSKVGYSCQLMVPLFSSLGHAVHVFHRFSSVRGKTLSEGNRLYFQCTMIHTNTTNHVTDLRLKFSGTLYLPHFQSNFLYFRKIHCSVTTWTTFRYPPPSWYLFTSA